MLTIEKLAQLGANTQEGLTRCMNNEAFYLRMVEMGLRDTGFDTLKEKVEGADLKEGFEAAHALKGVMANLALTPIYKPVSELTELLRSGTPGDYGALVAQVLEQKEKFAALLD